MHQHYELMVIFSPTLSDTEYKSVLKKYSELIKSEQGKMVESEVWGLKNLAYPINKKTVGFYWLATYSVTQENVTQFDKTLRTALWREESIMRYMITKLDKDALEYNLTRIEKQKSKALAREEKLKQENEQIASDNDGLLVDDSPLLD